MDRRPNVPGTPTPSPGKPAAFQRPSAPRKEVSVDGSLNPKTPPISPKTEDVAWSLRPIPLQNFTALSPSGRPEFKSLPSPRSLPAMKPPAAPSAKPTNKPLKKPSSSANSSFGNAATRKAPPSSRQPKKNPAGPTVKLEEESTLGSGSLSLLLRADHPTPDRDPAGRFLKGSASRGPLQGPVKAETETSERTARKGRASSPVPTRAARPPAAKRSSGRRGETRQQTLEDFGECLRRRPSTRTSLRVEKDGGHQDADDEDDNENGVEHREAGGVAGQDSLAAPDHHLGRASGGGKADRVSREQKKPEFAVILKSASSSQDTLASRSLERKRLEEAVWSLKMAEAGAVLFQRDPEFVLVERDAPTYPHRLAQVKAEAALSERTLEQFLNPPRPILCWTDLFPGASGGDTRGLRGQTLLNLWRRWIGALWALRSARWLAEISLNLPTTPVYRKLHLVDARLRTSTTTTTTGGHREPVSDARTVRFLSPTPGDSDMFCGPEEVPWNGPAEPVSAECLWGFYHFLHHRPTPCHWTSDLTTDVYVKECWEAWLLLQSQATPLDAHTLVTDLGNDVLFPSALMGSDREHLLHTSAYWKYLDECKSHACSTLSPFLPDCSSDPDSMLLLVWNDSDEELRAARKALLAAPYSHKGGSERRNRRRGGVPNADESVSSPPNPCLCSALSSASRAEWDESGAAMDAFLNRSNRDCDEDPVLTDVTHWKKVGHGPLDVRIWCTFRTSVKEGWFTGEEDDDEDDEDDDEPDRNPTCSCWTSLSALVVNPKYAELLAKSGFTAQESHRLTAADLFKDAFDPDAFEAMMLSRGGDLDSTEVIPSAESEQERQRSQQIARCWFDSLPSYPIDLSRCKATHFPSPAVPGQKRRSSKAPAAAAPFASKEDPLLLLGHTPP